MMSVVCHAPTGDGDSGGPDGKNADIRVAIIGNPNVGKTALFNALTGAKQSVGNWPGVTVEKKEGRRSHAGKNLLFVDLPGVYSLSAYSIDERIARDYIVMESPDVVVDIVDATNLERNLYLTLQLLELNANVIVALNMMDEAEMKGIEIDVQKLEDFLGLPVVPTVAIAGKGVRRLLDVILDVSQRGVVRRIKVGYGRIVEKALRDVEQIILKHGHECSYCVYRDLCLRSDRERHWVAVRLLEGDESVTRAVGDVAEDVLDIRRQVEARIGDIPAYLAKKRYELIDEIVHQCVRSDEMIETLTGRIDRVLLHRAFGIPIFLVFLWLTFKITFDLATPVVDIIDISFSLAGNAVRSGLGSSFLGGLIADGIISGLGSVLVFVPNIFLLFFVLSLLEDSGYLARAAFVMDRAMYRIGLHGKSFIPMLLGFGCNVPAIMATRTMENEKDRLLTILVNPLISCSARLPVYVLFAGAFFAYAEAGIIVSLYLLGILLAVGMALLLRRTAFGGRPAPFIMEMPPYRLPTLKSTGMHMWNRGRHFLRKAGTIIFLGVIAVYLLSKYPESGSGSYIAGVGMLIEPIFSPLGWSWRAVVALIFGFIAKEIVIGAFGVLYGTGEEGLEEHLDNDFTPVSAYSYMAFVLIYTPCLATLAAIWSETRSIRWTLFVVLYEIILAYVVALIIASIGGLLI